MNPGQAPVATPSEADRRRSPAGPIGLGVIGASAFADFCLQAWRDLPACRPTAVWNRTTLWGSDFAQRHGLAHHAELAALLGDPAVDCVQVASAPAAHAEQVAMALEAGRHVFCEKPLCTTSAEAAGLLELSERRGLRLGIDFVLRYGPLAGVVHDLLASEVLGTLLRGWVICIGSDTGLHDEHWFWRPQISGGIFIEHGVHQFDLLRWWFGELDLLTAQRNRRPGQEHSDQVHCELRTRTGADLDLTLGFHQTQELERHRVHLVCERGELCLDGWIAQRLRLRAALSERRAAELQDLLPGAQLCIQRPLPREARGSRRLDREPIDAIYGLDWQVPNDPQAIYAAALRRCLGDFLRGLRDPAHRPQVDSADGLAALRLAEAATARSVEDGP